MDNPFNLIGSVCGSNSYSNEVCVDGIPIVNTNFSGDISTNHPPIEVIGQFKIIDRAQTRGPGAKMNFPVVCLPYAVDLDPVLALSPG